MEVKERSGPFTEEFFSMLSDEAVVSQELITYKLVGNMLHKRTVRRVNHGADYHDTTHIEPLYKVNR